MYISEFQNSIMTTKVKNFGHCVYIYMYSTYVNQYCKEGHVLTIKAPSTNILKIEALVSRK